MDLTSCETQKFNTIRRIAVKFNTIRTKVDCLHTSHFSQLYLSYFRSLIDLYRLGGSFKSPTHSGLSPAVVAGIVIAVIVIIVVILVVAIATVRYKRRRIARYNDLAMNDDSDPLIYDSDPVA